MFPVLVFTTGGYSSPARNGFAGAVQSTISVWYLYCTCCVASTGHCIPLEILHQYFFEGQSGMVMVVIVVWLMTIYVVMVWAVRTVVM